MSQSHLFETLGAPLSNPRWSWGAIRPSDSVVFLRVWQDQTRQLDGIRFVRLTNEEKFVNDQNNSGYKERGKHVELIKKGASCFLVMCEAVDVSAVPREVKDFNKDEVFQGGKVIQLDGDWWVEMRARKKVCDVQEKVVGDSKSSVVGKAHKLFLDAGLAFPHIPKGLTSELKEQSEWLFTTRKLKTSPYNLDHYVEESDDAPESYVVLAHSGHGANSYAIQYYLVFGPLRLFLHLNWGGAHMHDEVAASKIRGCFSLADEIVPVALKSEYLTSSGNLLTIVGSDFYGSYWSAKPLKRSEERKRSQSPSEILAEVLHWLKSHL